MRSILERLGLAASRAAEAGRSETDTVRRIVRKLDHLPEERARFVAAFAYLLSRAARADLEISESETREMERIVAEHGKLPEDQAVVVVQMAKTQNLLFGGTENYLVAREFSALASPGEKLALVDCMYAVSAADDSITTVEGNVIRQIADELGIDRREQVAIRARYRDRLAVLRDPETAGPDGSA